MQNKHTDISDLGNPKNRKRYDHLSEEELAKEKPESNAHYDAKTHTDGNGTPLFDKARNILAILSLVIIAWIAISAVTKTPDQKFVEAVKEIRSSDARTHDLLNGLVEEAKRVDSNYKKIQEDGQSGRFYSRFIIKVHSGSVSVEPQNYITNE